MWWIKANLMLISFITLFSVSGYANEELTVDLPGGAQMEFVGIEPGTFMMGTTEEQEELMRSKEMWQTWLENEHPAHPVTISRGFYLGKYEITQGQWLAVMGTQPWLGKEYVQSNPNNPAVYIWWSDMQEFIHKLNQATGDSLYCLPTEAEWEYACRAGTNTLWSFGDDESRLRDYAWSADNAWNVGEKYAHAVGTKLPNPWGLFDMHGNVWEWCQDGRYRVYTTAAQQDPTGPISPSPRVVRGGDFGYEPYWTRSACRYNFEPGSRRYGRGARLLRMGPKSGTAVTPQTWGQVKKDAR